MAEDYAAKMIRKTDAELLLYVSHYPEYREEAVLAALDELARRDVTAPGGADLRARLLPVVQEQQAAAAAAAAAAVPAPEASVPTAAPAPAETGPALYSPVTIAVFSVLFSFVAGGVLLAINLFKLEERSKALRLLFFMVLYLVGSSLLVNWLGGAHLNRAQMLGAVVNIGAVLAYLLYFWPRYVGPRPYLSRQWLPALLICLGVALAMTYWLLPYVTRVTGLNPGAF